ncbi:unnamed protein product [Paramecium octaurelia]|uniref:Protein kinase domain-containing protein n=1 Tax=Paramecium octaurelia TaxID=43137 RepID=A0A8S1YKC6_PAROT|nr:unnamed protein product [Paramecium octaurelia]
MKQIVILLMLKDKRHQSFVLKMGVIPLLQQYSLLSLIFILSKDIKIQHYIRHVNFLSIVYLFLYQKKFKQQKYLWQDSHCSQVKRIWIINLLLNQYKIILLQKNLLNKIIDEKVSFNQCHKVQIYNDSEDQQKYIIQQISTKKLQNVIHHKLTINFLYPIVQQHLINLQLKLYYEAIKVHLEMYIQLREEIKLKLHKVSNEIFAKKEILCHSLIRYALTKKYIILFKSYRHCQIKIRFLNQQSFVFIDRFFVQVGIYLKLIKNSDYKLQKYWHLHKMTYINRNQKPENIVIDTQGYAMLTGFELSKEEVGDNYGAKSFCGSMAYWVQKCQNNKKWTSC